jgi:hypothetical protein
MCKSVSLAGDGAAPSIRGYTAASVQDTIGSGSKYVFNLRIHRCICNVGYGNGTPSTSAPMWKEKEQMPLLHPRCPPYHRRLGQRELQSVRRLVHRHGNRSSSKCQIRPHEWIQSPHRVLRVVQPLESHPLP